MRIFVAHKSFWRNTFGSPAKISRVSERSRDPPPPPPSSPPPPALGFYLFITRGCCQGPPLRAGHDSLSVSAQFAVSRPFSARSSAASILLGRSQRSVWPLAVYRSTPPRWGAQSFETPSGRSRTTVRSDKDVAGSVVSPGIYGMSSSGREEDRDEDRDENSVFPV